MMLYLDTCIWMNIIKKEMRFVKGKSLHDWAASIVNNSELEIVVSPIVIKELSYLLDKDFVAIENFLVKERDIHLIRSCDEDYKKARNLEKECLFAISFADCLHTCIANRLLCILVTWDKELIRVASSVVLVATPVDIVNKFV